MPNPTPAYGEIIPDDIDARVDVDRAADAALHRIRIEQTAARVAGIEIAARAEDRMRPLQEAAEGELPEQRAVVADRENAPAIPPSRHTGVDDSFRIDGDARHGAGAAVRFWIEAPEQTPAGSLDGHELPSAVVALHQERISVARRRINAARDAARLAERESVREDGAVEIDVDHARPR